MPLVIRCPHCQKPMQLADNSAGKQFRCPSCRNAFTVGGGQSSAVSAAAAGGAGAAVATLKARSSGTDRMTRGRSHVDDLDDAAMGATWEPPYRG